MTGLPRGESCQSMPCHLSTPTHGELVRDMALLAGEDIDSEALCLANLRVAEGACLDAEGDQRRIHRDAVERLAGEADRLVVGLGGDDGDAGGKVAEGFTETSGVDGGVSFGVGIEELHGKPCKNGEVISVSRGGGTAAIVRG